jgi:hypothetical protein
MNERIKELYTQVCMEQNLPFTLEHNSAYMLDAFADKFAELIVEEVYDYILNATFDDEPWPSRKDVKQHFGVAE